MAAPIFVTDGERDSRESICCSLEARGHRAKPFATARSCENACDSEQPGCVVLDVVLPDGCGLALQRRLRAREIAPPVIVMSRQATPRTAVTAMKQGALEFLEKPLSLETLLNEIRHALDCDSANRLQQARVAEASHRLKTLTSRERDVFDALMASRGTKQIAMRLGISQKTVDVHRSRVFTKMRVESVVELAGVAHLLGLFPSSVNLASALTGRSG